MFKPVIYVIYESYAFLSSVATKFHNLIVKLESLPVSLEHMILLVNFEHKIVDKNILTLMVVSAGP